MRHFPKLAGEKAIADFRKTITFLFCIIYQYFLSVQYVHCSPDHPELSPDHPELSPDHPELSPDHPELSPDPPGPTRTERLGSFFFLQKFKIFIIFKHSNFIYFMGNQTRLVLIFFFFRNPNLVTTIYLLFIMISLKL